MNTNISEQVAAQLTNKQIIYCSICNQRLGVIIKNAIVNFPLCEICHKTNTTHHHNSLGQLKIETKQRGTKK